MVDFSIFTGGENRLYIPPTLYLFIELANVVSLTWLICITPTKMKDATKRALSIPLLLLLLVFPITFSMKNNFSSFSVATVNFNLFLRFFELYWVGPFTLHKPAYTTLHQLSIDLWSFVRRFPEKKQRGTPEKSNKTLLSLVAYLIWFCILSDVLINWATSFTGNEVMLLMTERPTLYFIYCFTFGTLLYTCFKCLNYSIQLIHTLLFNKGSYSPELWRDVPKNPLLAKNLNDLWSNRWHQTFKRTWLLFPFKPVYIVCSRYYPKSLAYLVASLSVFFISGLMHEYVIAVNLGLHMYRQLMGEQVIFFMSQGVGIVLEFLFSKWVSPRLSPQFKKSYLYDLLQRLWAIVFIYSTFYYIFHGFLLLDFHLHHPFRLTRPYLSKLDKSYFGSQI